MAYDEHLAERIRELVGRERGLTERKMFGGLAFLINGNMSVAASGQGGLLVRVDPAQTDDSPGRLLTTLHVGQQICAPREDHRLRGIFSEPGCGLSDAPRRAVLKRRQAHHGRPPALASTPASALRVARFAGSLDARPSPPSRITDHDQKKTADDEYDEADMNERDEVRRK